MRADCLWFVIMFAASCAAQRPPAVRFADKMVAAVAAHDPRRVAALFAPDATATLVAAADLHGRPAIETATRTLFARFPDASILRGRTWIATDAAAAVLELVFTAHEVGVVGAAVLTLDPAGRATDVRVYVDVATIAWQRDRSQLPDGARVRPPATAPPAGTHIIAAKGSDAERARRATTDRTWERLVAHDPSGTLATVADDYVYDDYSGPAPLDRAGTQALVARFLAMVPDFTIAARPVEFAAGDDVVTESVEHMTFRGRAVTLHALDVKHFAPDGRVSREWQYANGVEVLVELLGLPAPTIK